MNKNELKAMVVTVSNVHKYLDELHVPALFKPVYKKNELHSIDVIFKDVDNFPIFPNTTFDGWLDIFSISEKRIINDFYTVYSENGSYLETLDESSTSSFNKTVVALTKEVQHKSEVNSLNITFTVLSIICFIIQVIVLKLL